METPTQPETTAKDSKTLICKACGKTFEYLKTAPHARDGFGPSVCSECGKIAAAETQALLEEDRRRAMETPTQPETTKKDSEALSPCTRCGKPQSPLTRGDLCHSCWQVVHLNREESDCVRKSDYLSATEKATAKDSEAETVVYKLCEAVCVCCAKAFEYESGSGLMEKYRPTICQPCCDKQQAEQEATDKIRQEDDQAARWKAICPPLYRDTDIKRLRWRRHGGKVDQVLEWQYSPRGLLLLGPTRAGKTRLMYKLLERLHVEGHNMHVTTCCGLGHELLSKIKDGSDWIGWMAYLAKVPILAIDDLGKGAMTERVTAELFDLIEQRMAFLRPIIATTNMLGDELSAHVGDDRGVALVARLRECCESVSLTLPEKK